MEPQIFIVGENGFDSKIAYYHKNKGHIKPVCSGVFIRAGLSQEKEKEIILSHACRIAKYLHPKLVLAGASAYHHAAIDDTIILASNMKYRPKKIGDYLWLRYMYVKAPYNLIPHEIASVSDPSGEINVQILTDEMIILQAFTKTRGPNSDFKISIRDLQTVIERAIIHHKSKDALIKKMEVLAENMDYGYQFERAKDFVERASLYSQEKRNLYEYGVFWNKREIATLTNDGIRWDFEYAKNFGIPISISSKTTEGRVPFFIESLIPEGWNQIGHSDDANYNELKAADRYTSNIVIRPRDRKNEIIVDSIEGELRDFCDKKSIFQGRIEGFPGGFDDEFFDEIGRLCQDTMAPRMSGVQIKIPANLSTSGILSPALGKSFTHIVKMPAPGEMSTMGSMEWYTMAMAYLCKIQTEAFGIMNIEGLGPAFIAERFDIRRNLADKAMIICEDFCSAMGLKRGQKYDGEMADVANLLLSVSTEPELDARMLFRQTVFSWIASNSDMHLKNLLLIKTANEDMTGFKSVRLSPAYDIMCTRVYSQGRAPSAAISIAGQKMYTVDSFMILAKCLNIPKDEADSIMKETIILIQDAIEKLDMMMPEPISSHEMSRAHIEACKRLVEIRTTAMIGELNKPNKYRFKFHSSEENKKKTKVGI